MRIRMSIIIAFIICISLLFIQSADAKENVSIKLNGVPDQMIFPLAKGKNQILTATIKGDEIKNVWLAPNLDSTARILLTKVDDNEYQINLADPMVSAILVAAENKQFFIFTETADQQVTASIPVQYSVKQISVPLTEANLYLNKGENREKIKQYDYYSGWQDPAKINSFEIEYLPVEAEITASAEAGGKSFAFKKGEEGSGKMILINNEKIRKEWINSGSIQITWTKCSDKITFNVIPDELKFDKVPESLNVFQHRSEYLRCSNRFLDLSLGDITAGQVQVNLSSRQYYTKIIDKHSMKQGEIIDFSFGQKDYRISLLSLVNVAFGEDHAVFLISPKVLTESQKIGYLIEALRASNLRLIKDQKEYYGEKASDLLRSDFGIYQNKYKTMQDFLSAIKQDYTVRQFDGTVIELKTWLNGIAKKFIKVE